MNMKIKRPTPAPQTSHIEDVPVSTSTATEKARFITEANRRPTDSIKTIPSQFRLPQWVINVLEDQAARTGYNKTDILKAFVYGASLADEHQIDRWLLESKKQ